MSVIRVWGGKQLDRDVIFKTDAFFEAREGMGKYYVMERVCDVTASWDTSILRFELRPFNILVFYFRTHKSPSLQLR